MTNLTRCPQCSSRKVRKDYAPAKGYALIVTGMGMLFVRSFLNPVLFQPAIGVESHRLLVLGLMLFAYGVYSTFKHDNRYCASCGYKFRRPDPQAAEPATNEPHNNYASREPEPRDAHATSSATSFKPLLACLKFKDPTQRANAAQTLKEMTGQDFGEDHQAWSDWFKNNKDAHNRRPQ